MKIEEEYRKGLSYGEGITWRHAAVATLRGAPTRKLACGEWLICHGAGLRTLLMSASPAVKLVMAMLVAAAIIGDVALSPFVAAGPKARTSIAEVIVLGYQISGTQNVKWIS